MEQFKIGHYEAEHGKGSFPEYTLVAEPEKWRILHEWVAWAKGEREFMEEMDRRCLQDYGKWAKDSDFNLGDVLSSLGVIPSERVYLYWCYPGTIEMMGFEDVRSNFDDIWYPGPDDLLLLDTSAKWAVFVDHEGWVRSVVRHANDAT